MFLRHRLIRPDDLEECFSISRDRHVFSDRERADLIRFWQEVLREERALHSFIEEERPDGSRRAAYFCICVPLAETFVAGVMQGTRPPSFSHHVLSEWREGRSPVPSVREIAAANAGVGLPVFVMHSGWPDNLTEVEHQSVVEKIAQWIPYANAGYRLTELLIEAYTDWQLNWSTSAAFTLRLDYADFDWKLPEGRCDCIFGLSRAESLVRVGGPFSGLFKHVTPRFRFNTGERALLQQALCDESDTEIADLLCVSPETVKKRWTSIFSKVEQAAPDMLPEISARDICEPGNREDRDRVRSRGPEKRRRLLAYLRHHMEEVRPYGRE